MVADQPHEKTWQANVDKSGRVLLPAELRRLLDAQPGASLLWVKDDHGLHLKSFQDSLTEIQNYYQSLSPGDIVWSDEIIERRKVEAKHD